MIQKLSQSSGNVVGFAVRGKMVEEDYELLETEMKSLIREHGQIRLLCSVEDMSGFDLDVADDELRMSHYLGDMERVAMVSDSRFYEWALSVWNVVTDVEIRHFEPGEEAQAWAWLK